jgi:hypothetical protein
MLHASVMKHAGVLIVAVVFLSGCAMQTDAFTEQQASVEEMPPVVEEAQLHPMVAMIRSEASPVQHGGRLSAVRFTSSFEVHDLAGEQVIYTVQVLDKAGKPIQSRDGLYSTPRGTVGATRAMMVRLSPDTFENVSVAIPTKAMGITRDDLPIEADIGVYRPDGQVLTRTRCPVPVSVASGR